MSDCSVLVESKPVDQGYSVLLTYIDTRNPKIDQYSNNFELKSYHTNIAESGPFRCNARRIHLSPFSLSLPVLMARVCCQQSKRKLSLINVFIAATSHNSTGNRVVQVV